MKSRYILWMARISLCCIFLVIIAGSIVRMTGSGMGCPDWPRCYGYLIPPTDVEPLTYTEGRSFEKGQMVILNDTLWVANEAFSAGAIFDRSLWHKYPKHDYAIFNATHTWIEYINRLATVLLGFPVIILFVLSTIHWLRKKDFLTFLWAGLAVFMLGFEAWLGKLVVDGNLKENSITLHMLGSLALVAFILLLLKRHSGSASSTVAQGKLKWLWLAMLVFSFLQVMMGTQVRESIDVIAKTGLERSGWIEQLPVIFPIHRSFSILIVLLGFWIVRETKRQNINHLPALLLLSILGLEILAGVSLSYLGMPAGFQPVHLFFGVVLFAYCFYQLSKILGKGLRVVSK